MEALVDRLATRYDAGIALLARILMATLFMMAGLSKVGHVREFTDTLASDGVPILLGGLVFWFLILSGLLLVLGAATRIVALMMAGFSMLSGFLAYGDLAQSTDMVMLLKNISLTGGYLFIMLHGPGRYSIDHWRQTHANKHSAQAPQTP